VGKMKMESMSSQKLKLTNNQRCACQYNKTLVLDQLEIGELEQQILPMTSQKQPVTITLVEY
jgi:hypothetical protein